MGARIRQINYLQHTINDNNPDALWEDFKTRFLFVADIHAPQITRKVKSEYTPWMTNNIKKQIYPRDFPWPEIQDICTEHVRTLKNKMAETLL